MSSTRIGGVDYNPGFPKTGNRAEIEELKSALRRLVKRVLGLSTPEVDKSVATAVKAWFKGGYNKRHVILLPDVSDSTSAAPPEVVQACKEYCEIDHRAVLIVHENGVPRTVFGCDVTPGCFGAVDGKDKLDEQVLFSWRFCLKQWEAGLAVAFGDSEAVELYRLMCETFGYHFVWLDSYNARGGIQPIPPTRFSDWKRPPLAVWRGINSAKDAAAALRQVVKAFDKNQKAG